MVFYEHDLLIITDQGVIIRVSAEEIPTLSRATSGVRLMRSKDARIVDFALTDHEVEEEDDAEGTEAAEGEAPAESEADVVTEADTADADVKESEGGEDNA